MDNVKKYFLISLEQLGQEKLFPFHLYVYNPANKQYSAYLFANSPLTPTKESLLQEISEKGGQLAILMKQKRTFLTEQKLKESEIEDLAPKQVHSLEKRRDERLQEENKKENTKDTHLKDHLLNAAKNDDFMPLIEGVRNELIVFSPRISSTTTMSSLLAERLLVEDNFINRTVVLSYTLAKASGITDQESLADLVCAAYFSHLGYTQIPHLCMNKPQLEYSDSLRKEWRKHPGLSMHILRKARIDLSGRCKDIIEQHHERYSGQGFPQMKKSTHIEPLALVLGAASHILEFTSGKISNTKSTVSSYIMNLKNKTYLPGMEYDFGPLLEESLNHLVDTMNSSDENKKVA